MPSVIIFEDARILIYFASYRCFFDVNFMVVRGFKAFSEVFQNSSHVEYPDLI